MRFMISMVSTEEALFCKLVLLDVLPVVPRQWISTRAAGYRYGDHSSVQSVPENYLNRTALSPAGLGSVVLSVLIE